MHRSGTLFLSTIMNSSPTWSVIHQSGRDEVFVWNPPNQRYAQLVQKRFERENYGEVSWCLISIIEFLKLQRKGLIFRDPAEVWLSYCNIYQSEEKAYKKLYYFYPLYQKMAELAESGQYRIISFRRMTSDTDYLVGVLNDFGIEDVEITSDTINTKIHQPEKYIYGSIEELHAEVKPEIELWRKLIRKWLD